MDQCSDWPSWTCSFHLDARLLNENLHLLQVLFMFVADALRLDQLLPSLRYGYFKFLRVSKFLRLVKMLAQFVSIHGVMLIFSSFIHEIIYKNPRLWSTTIYGCNGLESPSSNFFEDELLTMKKVDMKLKVGFLQRQVWAVFLVQR